MTSSGYCVRITNEVRSMYDRLLITSSFGFSNGEGECNADQGPVARGPADSAPTIFPSAIGPDLVSSSSFPIADFAYCEVV